MNNQRRKETRRKQILTYREQTGGCEGWGVWENRGGGLGVYLTRWALSNVENY